MFELTFGYANNDAKNYPLITAFNRKTFRTFLYSCIVVEKYLFAFELSLKEQLFRSLPMFLTFSIYTYVFDTNWLKKISR